MRQVRNLSILADILTSLDPVLGLLVAQERQRTLTSSILGCLSVRFIVTWSPFAAQGHQDKHPAVALLSSLQALNPHFATQARGLILEDVLGATEPVGVLLSRLIFATSALDPSLGLLLENQEERPKTIKGLLSGVEHLGPISMHLMEVGGAMRKLVQVRNAKESR